MIQCFDEEGNLHFDSVCAASHQLLSLQGNACIELMFITKQEIQELNARTRAIDKPTDVLSFPFIEFDAAPPKPFTAQNYPLDYQEEGVFIGSIMICQEVAKAQAIEYGHSYQRELTYLFAHGLLHLFGYDHEVEEDKKVMRALEEKILAQSLKQ